MVQQSNKYEEHCKLPAPPIQQVTMNLLLLMKQPTAIKSRAILGRAHESNNVLRQFNMNYSSSGLTSEGKSGSYLDRERQEQGCCQFEDSEGFHILIEDRC